MSWELNALLGEKEFLGHKFSEKVSFIIADASLLFFSTWCKETQAEPLLSMLIHLCENSVE